MIRSLLTACTVTVLAASQLYATEARLVATGAGSDLQEDLEAASLALGAVEEGTTDGQELIAAAQADYQRMVAALYENGYFGGMVSIKLDGTEAADVSPLRRVASVNNILITVVPGPRYRFSRAQIAPLPRDAEPVEGYRVGETATTPVIRRAAQDGVDDWREAGHAKADVAGQDIVAEHANATVRSRIDLAPGPFLRFGRALLSERSQTSAVRQERIVAIAGIPTGEAFSPQEVREAQRRLRRTGAFRSAVVDEAEVPNRDGSLDMIVDVEDTLPRRFGFGLELSSDEGAAANAYWLHRNLFGGAERFRIDGDVSGVGGDSGGIDYGLTAQLTRPAFLHPDNDARFRITLEHNDEPAYVSDLFEAIAGVQRYFSEDLTGEFGLGVRFARVEDAYGERNFNHVLGRGDLTWDRRDDELDPRSGYYTEVGAIPFLGIDGSESGARLSTDLRAFYSFTERFTLAGRVQAGSVLGASIEGTPPEFLFFSGGGGTVRGQDYQSLSGAIVAGQPVGGRSFLGLSGEIRAKVTDSIGVVGFVDYGYVSPDPDFSGGDDHAGAGIGGRYYTPIGPVRFDIAVPISGESGYGIYVGIGQAF